MRSPSTGSTVLGPRSSLGPQHRHPTSIPAWAAARKNSTPSPVQVTESLMEARVNQAKANLRVVEQQLRDLLVIAPFDGTVLRLLKRPGEGVRMIELEPVVIFGDLSRLRVRAEIDERFVKDLRVGQTADVYGRNLLGNTYSGRMVEVEKIMGGKTVFTRASSERKDLNVLQIVIEMESGFSAPVGLQVDVRIHREGS
jgi:HlyD family secretion protein